MQDALYLFPSQIFYFFSKSNSRNELYSAFLEKCRNEYVTIADVVRFGHDLMVKERINHHFFADYTLLSTAQFLAFYALKMPHNIMELELRVTEEDASKIISLYERRISQRIPVEYITNEAYYLGRKFYVNENVLVPRSIMNTRFHDFLTQTKWENYRVLDLCTGSGCIGISLALMNPKIKVDLVDISPKALAVAQINIDKYNLNDRVTCIQSDLFENVKHKYDLIISNPPYVSTSEYEASAPEFKNEPKIALECGKDGLDLVRKMIAQSKRYLNPHGRIIGEVGIYAIQRMKKIYKNIPFQWLKYRRPNGHVSFFGMPGIFVCQARDLPE